MTTTDQPAIVGTESHDFQGPGPTCAGILGYTAGHPLAGQRCGQLPSGSRHGTPTTDPDILGSVVYLAQPIDQAGPSSVPALLAGDLRTAGFNVYRPGAAWAANPEHLDPRIEAVNRAALQACDLLVAWLPAGVPTIGVPMEIEQATARGVPAIVVTDIRSFALAGNPWVTVVPQDQILKVSLLARELLETAGGPRVAGGTAPADDEPGTTGGWAPELRVVVPDPEHLPSRAYPDDAGWDLTVSGSLPLTIEPGQFVDIECGVTGVQTPDGCWLMITGRSSTLRKRGLHVPVAVIDPGWRGPLYTGVWNLSAEPVNVFPGDRLAQAIPIPMVHTELMRVAAHRLDPHPRGLSGFGSSGT